MQFPIGRAIGTLRIFGHSFCYLISGISLAGAVGFIGLVPAAAVTISTYHSDGQRTGWNSQETALTPSTVGSAAFKQIGNVALDAQVDAQPLYVGSQTITGQGVHNVLYVATENDTVYAIDADTGAILLQQNFGTPVTIS